MVTCLSNGKFKTTFFFFLHLKDIAVLVLRDKWENKGIDLLSYPLQLWLCGQLLNALSFSSICDTDIMLPGIVVWFNVGWTNKQTKTKKK